MSRLISLDAFRGAILFLMVLVNKRGGPGMDTFTPLLHSAWHGWTFADLVFPAFLWIIGVSMVLSFSRRIEGGLERRRLLLHTLRRTVLLFGLGLILTGIFQLDFSRIYITGVLQRIALCYLIGAVIFLYTSWHGQICWIFGIFIVYWQFMLLFSVPDHGPGALTPDGNFARFLDHTLLFGYLTQHEGTDSSGLMGTLTATSNVLLGVLCGQYLQRKDLGLQRKAIGIGLVGAIFLMTAYLLDPFMLPINKKLWTPHYVILTTGFTCLGFACFYWVIEGLNQKDWSKPFVVYGSNAITVYAASVVFAKLLSVSGVKWLLYGAFVYFTSHPKVASLLYALLCVSATYMLAWYLHRKQLLLRI